MCERERDTDTDTWFIVKATDPYTKGGEGGKYGRENIHTYAHSNMQSVKAIFEVTERQRNILGQKLPITPRLKKKRKCKSVSLFCT